MVIYIVVEWLRTTTAASLQDNNLQDNNHNHKIPHNHKPSYKFWLRLIVVYI